MVSATSCGSSESLDVFAWAHMADSKQQSLGCGGLFVVAAVLVGIGRMCSGKDDDSAAKAAALAAPPSPPPARPAAEPSPTRVAAAEPPPGYASKPALKGSRAAFRGWFTRLGLEFEDSPLADGTPREMARSNLIVVETIGFGDTLERTSLMVGLAKDDTAGLLAATGAILVFMRETGWQAGQSWVTTTMKKGGGEIVKNGVRYKLLQVMPGMFNLSAKSAKAKDE